MIYKINDREYDFDGVFTVGEAMMFWDRAQVGVNEINPNLVRGNPYVIATFMYVLKKRAKEAVSWDDMRGFDVTAFDLIPDDTDQAADGVEQADPTRNGGPTLEAATTAT